MQGKNGSLYFMFRALTSYIKLLKIPKNILKGITSTF